MNTSNNFAILITTNFGVFGNADIRIGDRDHGHVINEFFAYTGYSYLV